MPGGENTDGDPNCARSDGGEEEDVAAVGREGEAAHEKGRGRGGEEGADPRGQDEAEEEGVVVTADAARKGRAVVAQAVETGGAHRAVVRARRLRGAARGAVTPGLAAGARRVGVLQRLGARRSGLRVGRRAPRGGGQAAQVVCAGGEEQVDRDGGVERGVRGGEGVGQQRAQVQRVDVGDGREQRHDEQDVEARQEGVEAVDQAVQAVEQAEEEAGRVHWQARGVHSGRLVRRRRTAPTAGSRTAREERRE